MRTSVGVISWLDSSSGFRKIRVCNTEEETEVQRQELGRLWGRIEGQAEACRVGGTGGVAVRTTVRWCWVSHKPAAQPGAWGCITHNSSAAATSGIKIGTIKIFTPEGH